MLTAQLAEVMAVHGQARGKALPQTASGDCGHPGNDRRALGVLVGFFKVALKGRSVVDLIRQIRSSSIENVRQVLATETHKMAFG